jgi:hypothetical protein
MAQHVRVRLDAEIRLPDVFPHTQKRKNRSAAVVSLSLIACGLSFKNACRADHIMPPRFRKWGVHRGRSSQDMMQHSLNVFTASISPLLCSHEWVTAGRWELNPS